MGKQLAFYFDASACNGCKACVIACKSKNQLPVGVNWRRVHQYGGGGWTPDPDEPTLIRPNGIFAYSMSISCMHCARPACMEACPAGGITKRPDGVVVMDSSRCVGCRYCEWACPYGAPQFDQKTGVASKCNMCIDLIEQGQKPYCVAACVMRALDVGELDELRARYGDVDAIEPLPRADITSPSIVVTPHRHAQASGAGTGRVLDLEEVQS